MSHVAAMQEEHSEEESRQPPSPDSRVPLLLSEEEGGEKKETSPEKGVVPLPQELQRILDQETQRRWLKRQKTLRQRPVEKDW